MRSRQDTLSSNYSVPASFTSITRTRVLPGNSLVNWVWMYLFAHLVQFASTNFEGHLLHIGHVCDMDRFWTPGMVVIYVHRGWLSNLKSCPFTGSCIYNEETNQYFEKAFGYEEPRHGIHYQHRSYREKPEKEDSI